MRYDVTIVHSSVPSHEARHGDWVPRAVGWKRKTHIRNLSGANAYVIVSNHRVALLKHLDIDRIGSVDVEHTGDGDKTQEFRVMSGDDRKVRLTTYNFYVTSFLFVDNKWMRLWENRMFNCAHDINLLPKHIDEAKFDEGSRPALPPPAGRGIAHSLEEVVSGITRKKPKRVRKKKIDP